MDFVHNRTWPVFYDYIPVYEIWIQYPNVFKRYRPETIFVRTWRKYVRTTYVRTDKGNAISPPHYKWRGHKKSTVQKLKIFIKVSLLQWC